MTGRNYGIFRNFTLLGRVTNCWNASLCRTLPPRGNYVLGPLDYRQIRAFRVSGEAEVESSALRFITPKSPLG